MYPRRQWKRALAIIDRLYRQFACVSYKRFVKRWTIGRTPKNGKSSPPSQQTFSRIWLYYQHQNRLKTIRGKRLTEWLSTQFGHRTLDLGLPRPELEDHISKAMVTQSLVMPSAYRFRRCLITAQHTIREEENEYRLTRLEKSLDAEVGGHLQLPARRFPPVPCGSESLR